MSPTAARPSRRGVSGLGGSTTRAPIAVADLEPLELDGLRDDDGWSEVAATGAAIAADAERVSFSRSTITGVRFTGAQLHRLEMTDVTLLDCDLANVVLEELSLDRVAFVGCRLNEADLGGASLIDVRFTDCQMEDLALRMVRTERLHVSGGSAARVDLYRAKLHGSRWYDVDLTGADLSGAEMARSRLHGSKIIEVRGAKALKDTVIDPHQAIDVGQALLADATITIDEART